MGSHVASNPTSQLPPQVRRGPRRRGSPARQVDAHSHRTTLMYEMHTHIYIHVCMHVGGCRVTGECGIRGYGWARGARGSTNFEVARA